MFFQVAQRHMWQRIALVLVVCFVLLAEGGMAVQAGPTDDVRILFEHEIAEQPGTRAEFTIAYWLPIAPGNCTDFGDAVIHRITLNNHQRQWINGLSAGPLCIYHEVQDVDGVSYRPDETLCRTMDFMEVRSNIEGEIQLYTGERLRCTVTAAAVPPAE